MKRFTNKQKCLDWLAGNFNSYGDAINAFNDKLWTGPITLLQLESLFKQKHTELDSKQQLEQRVMESFNANSGALYDGEIEKWPDNEFDVVEKPKHYQFFDGVEAIELIAASMTQDQFYGYCLGNKLKYRLRAGEKDDLQQDINKSNKYEELYELHKDKCKRAIELNDS